jgi:hypothetical protein
VMSRSVKNPSSLLPLQTGKDPTSNLRIFSAASIAVASELTTSPLAS